MFSSVSDWINKGPILFDQQYLKGTLFLHLYISILLFWDLIPYYQLCLISIFWGSQSSLVNCDRPKYFNKIKNQVLHVCLHRLIQFKKSWSLLSVSVSTMTEVNCLKLFGEFTSGVNVEVFEAEAFKQIESISDLFFRVWMRPPALVNFPVKKQLVPLCNM